MVLHNKKVFIFGGKTWINNYCTLGDLEYFNLVDKSWSFPALPTKSLLQVRRNHIAECFGNNMIIHGGINENGDLLNDAHVLGLQPLKWTEKLLTTDHPTAPYLAFHSSCLVLPRDVLNHPKLSVYKIPDSYKRRNEFTKTEVVSKYSNIFRHMKKAFTCLEEKH